MTLNVMFNTGNTVSINTTTQKSVESGKDAKGNPQYTTKTINHYYNYVDGKRVNLDQAVSNGPLKSVSNELMQIIKSNWKNKADYQDFYFNNSGLNIVDQNAHTTTITAQFNNDKRVSLRTSLFYFDFKDNKFNTVQKTNNYNYNNGKRVQLSNAFSTGQFAKSQSLLNKTVASELKTSVGKLNKHQFSFTTNGVNIPTKGNDSVAVNILYNNQGKASFAGITTKYTTKKDAKGKDVTSTKTTNKYFNYRNNKVVSNAKMYSGSDAYATAQSALTKTIKKYKLQNKVYYSSNGVAAGAYALNVLYTSKPAQSISIVHTQLKTNSKKQLYVDQTNSYANYRNDKSVKLSNAFGAKGSYASANKIAYKVLGKSIKSGLSKKGFYFTKDGLVVASAKGQFLQLSVIYNGKSRKSFDIVSFKLKDKKFVPGAPKYYAYRGNTQVTLKSALKNPSYFGKLERGLRTTMLNNKSRYPYATSKTNISKRAVIYTSRGLNILFPAGSVAPKNAGLRVISLDNSWLK
ncbi:hypothetical protein ABVF11_08795 [Pediococcus argentinicus]|uniref:hypothetical protein n=1 Tax=Pediococcus argentinicus TaxID=480391 RepID=UPI00338E9C44